MKIDARIWSICEETGEEVKITVEMPARWVVCEECQGSGTELYGSLKGHAFTMDEMNEDPEFRENYFGGAYDVQCSRCKGRTTVPALYREGMTDEQKAMMETHDRIDEAYWEAKYQDDRIASQERAMGC